MNSEGLTYTFIRSTPDLPELVAMEVIHRIICSVTSVIEDGQVVYKLS